VQQSGEKIEFGHHGALSSEVDTGSREESASEPLNLEPLRFDEKRKDCSSSLTGVLQTPDRIDLRAAVRMRNFVWRFGRFDFIDIFLT